MLYVCHMYISRSVLSSVALEPKSKSIISKVNQSAAWHVFSKQIFNKWFIVGPFNDTVCYQEDCHVLFPVRVYYYTVLSYLSLFRTLVFKKGRKETNCP